MSKMQRTKGQTGEREFAHLIEDNLGVECHRRIEQTRDSGHDLDLYEYAIEIKRSKTKNMKGWWRQTVTNANEINKIPVLAYRLDRKKWCVVMSLGHVINGYGYPVSDIDSVDPENTDMVLTFTLDGWFHYIKQKL